MKHRRLRRSPLLDGWVCPNCGQTGSRHGRGGSRACKAREHGLPGNTCPGLVCECGTGVCYSRTEGRGWRRSPCKNAHCQHCGWRSEIRSRSFEREFGLARCSMSHDGWHRVVPDIGSNSEPDAIYLTLRCVLCGYEGRAMVHPIDDTEWVNPHKPPDE